jgi:hypothetical protein
MRYASETYRLFFPEFSTSSPKTLSSRDSVPLPRGKFVYGDLL